MKSIMAKLALCVAVLAFALIGGIFTRRLGTYQALVLMLAPWAGWSLLALVGRRNRPAQETEG